MANGVVVLGIFAITFAGMVWYGRPGVLLMALGVWQAWWWAMGVGIVLCLLAVFARAIGGLFVAQPGTVLPINFEILVALLMGFLALSGGRIAILGEDPLTRLQVGRVGWMSEQPAFPSAYRVSELIRFQAATFPSWDESLGRELIERLEIDPSARAKRLSRGQAGRLALLFALAHRPRLLILDDPTLGLDPAARRILLGELLAASAQNGTGILLSTHLLAEVDRALDRLLILDQGKLVLDRKVDDLKDDASAHRASPGQPPANLEEIFIAHTGGAR